MVFKEYYDNSEKEIKEKLVKIVKKSSNEEEIRRKIIEELNYPYGRGAIAIYLSDITGRDSYRVAVFYQKSVISIL